MRCNLFKYGHSFLGLNETDQVSIINTNGNPYAHVVLRGGNGKPNYDAAPLLKRKRFSESKSEQQNHD